MMYNNKGDRMCCGELRKKFSRSNHAENRIDASTVNGSITLDFTQA